MEKAKLQTSQSKKGNIIVDVIFVNNGKRMTIQNCANQDILSYNGQEVDVTREGGQIVKVASLQGKELYSKAQTSQIQARPSTKNDSQTRGAHSDKNGFFEMYHTKHIPPNHQATAPYNFVPLNNIVVDANEQPGRKNGSFDKYHLNKNTGHIDLTINTVTPFYIKGNVSEKMMRKGKTAKDISDFFSPAGKIRVPGSSIRGMVRTLVEISSFGKFGFLDDKRLYFRAVADRSKLGDDYRSIMVNESKNQFPHFCAGVLKKVKHAYVIHPSKELPMGNNGTQIYRINFDKQTKVVSGTKDFVVPDFEYKEVYFQPVAPADHPHSKRDGKQHLLKYALLRSISQTQNPSHPNGGFIIASGKFMNKHMHWVINEPENDFIPIEESVVTEYKNDSSRDEKANLLEKIKTHPKNEVPCFYITDKQKRVISFGHTGMFRLAYSKKIGEHIPLGLKDKATLDIAEAIFGNHETFAGRLFFEDAFLQTPTNDDCEEMKISKTLLGPKPTTFQHYLVQTDGNLVGHPKHLAHYNSSNDIRGNKLYWHKPANWKKENQKEFNQKIEIKMKPVKSNKTFTGRIRFENLSDVELGALLFALDLPDNCCHKLGMGKPLGLGTVKITPKLFLSDRKTRYTNLLAEWDAAIPESTAKDKDIPHFKKQFAAYVLKKLEITPGAEPVNTLWEIDRMKELKTMLVFDKKRSDENIQYMKLPEFKERRVLPNPTVVHPLL